MCPTIAPMVNVNENAKILRVISVCPPASKYIRSRPDSDKAAGHPLYKSKCAASIYRKTLPPEVITLGSLGDYCSKIPLFVFAYH